jgi:hypothetical protein
MVSEPVPSRRVIVRARRPSLDGSLEDVPGAARLAPTEQQLAEGTLTPQQQLRLSGRGEPGGKVNELDRCLGSAAGRRLRGGHLEGRGHGLIRPGRREGQVACPCL